MLAVQCVRKHRHHIAHQTLLNLSPCGTVVHDPTNLAQPEYFPLGMRNIGEPIFSPEGHEVMLAHGVKSTTINHHAVINYAV